MIKIEEVEVGKSYGCKFRVITMLDDSGKPVVDLGDALPKAPGEYEGFGVIQMRDLNNRLVELYDTTARKMFTVSFNDIWDIDTVEWVD
jgi:hypothetical protein